MSPKKRQKKSKDESPRAKEEQQTMACSGSNSVVKQSYFHSNIEEQNIIQNQDDEFEMSVIMDIIKMQEKEDIERIEKEKQQEIEREKERQEKLMKRDHNIKEILRKMKLQMCNLSSFEISLIQLLENTMDTQDLVIVINDKDFYDNIHSYLGITNKRGSIRVNEDVKEFARYLFQLKVNTSSS